MIKLLWSVIGLYLCVCFVIASIYTNTSRYTNLHTTFYYKPILIICIKLKKIHVQIKDVFDKKDFC